MGEKVTKGHIDWYLLIAVAGLMMFSIAFVYSASATIAEVRFGSADRLFINHIGKIGLALIAMLFFAKFDYHKYQNLSKYFIYIAIIPLLLVFVIGHQINGAYRWLDLGFFNFQPSELAKFALILHLSAMLTERQEVIRSFKYGLLPLLVWTLIISALIAIEPNFSTAAVVFIIAYAMMLIGNTNVLHLSTIMLISVTGAGLYAVSASYRFHRLLAFIGLEQGNNTVSDAAYQIQQAILAFGNGGFLGMGPGNSQQSHLFLPESYGDFIFSVIGEEYGFIGVFAIIAVFAFIFWRGLKIAKNAPDTFGYFLASGIIITFAMYAFVSAGVNCGLLPTTGLPMPFVSYGGTAVIFYGAAMGILLNISAYSGLYPLKSSKLDAFISENAQGFTK